MVCSVNLRGERGTGCRGAGAETEKIMFGTGRRSLGASALAAAILAGASGTAVAATSAATGPAAVPGWRIVSTDHRSGSVDDQIAVTAISPTNAWTGGNVASSHSSVGVPFVEHWNGRSWRSSALPGGLAGGIEIIGASAWNNVWAFGADFHGNGGFALRFDGHKWRLMRRFPGPITIAGAAVNSPSNVWVFTNYNGVVRHYNGRRWLTVTPSSQVNWYNTAVALPDGQVWALAHAGGGEEAVTGTLTKAGYTWTSTPLPSFPPTNDGSDALMTIVPVSATDVWAVGGGLRTVKGHDHWYPLVAHWNGAGWQKVSVSGSFMLGKSGASDGHGGLWVATDWDSTGIPPHLLHLVNGKFTKVNLPPRNGLYVGVFALAKIPGSASVWGAGALTGLGSTGTNIGIILKYGH
jgi:hypothetical protein